MKRAYFTIKDTQRTPHSRQTSAAKPPRAPEAAKKFESSRCHTPDQCGGALPKRPFKQKANSWAPSDSVDLRPGSFSRKQLSCDSNYSSGVLLTLYGTVQHPSRPPSPTVFSVRSAKLQSLSRHYELERSTLKSSEQSGVCPVRVWRV